MRQGSTAPVRKLAESDKAFYERVKLWARSDYVRSKSDNREWTGSLPFHLDHLVPGIGSEEGKPKCG